ncbi:aminoglycoside phosphotransferase family protein [Chlorobium phaeovibrioides]|uniref:Phosphotransferase n=1 Tax=Chlorobium phaeovibrioides TaxID=1094 RepID=A0A3S0LQX4_CHLPH|nr:phosphotransferase [Chlorobium phaeovibrioides]MWV53811.1 phosphotransferase [Chlorobium phaeovibrioides]QEQ56387.1 phosphotransferase [Chlorobium phaeovibrioides]RTY39483.1 aminoglycoside phosphotransferase [Chlorobium phaeovibrioides]
MTIENNIRILSERAGLAPVSITPVQGDASGRQYFRIFLEKASLIGCHDPAFASLPPQEAYPFLHMQQMLSAKGVRVPEVIAKERQSGTLLLEDCGNLLLQNAAEDLSPDAAADLYRSAVDTMLLIQSMKGEKNSLPFSLAFDREKLMFEFDFFIEHALLGYFSEVFNPLQAGALRREFETIADMLVLPDRFVPNHRDYHSRNILIHDATPVIIDFQDARMGLAQYDAASLLRDSYIRIDDALREELTLRHHQGLIERELSCESYEEYLHYFTLSSFQRSIKAIGTFCFQTVTLGKQGYEHSIAPTLAYLEDYRLPHPELKKAMALLAPLYAGVS